MTDPAPPSPWSWPAGGEPPPDHVPRSSPFPPSAAVPASAPAGDPYIDARPPTTPVAGRAPAGARPGRWAPLEPWLESGDLRAAAGVVGVLALIGVPAGVLWGRISPHSQGFVSAAGKVIPDEAEGFVAADGRYLAITAVIGLVAGVAGWLWRSRRGPVLAAGIGLGGLAGATLTALVGHWVSAGQDAGAVGAVIRLPVSLHAHGLIAAQGALAVGAYLLGVLVSGPDDLGRPGPVEPSDPGPDERIS